MNVTDFARGTEKMVDPMAVGKTHYVQTKLRRMPVWLQKKGRGGGWGFIFADFYAGRDDGGLGGAD